MARALHIFSTDNYTSFRGDYIAQHVSVLQQENSVTPGELVSTPGVSGLF